MFVLGIDPGLTRSGYGIVQRSSPPVARTAGVITTSADDPLETRLLELHTDLVEVIEEYRPHVVAIERVFTNRNLQTAISVGRASGVAVLAAAQAGLRVFEYTPTTVKAAITGDGSADKRMVGEMVRRRLNLDRVPRPADAADALAVALCHLQTTRVAVNR